MFVDGHVAKFIDNEKLWLGVGFQLTNKVSLFLGSDELVDDVDSSGKEDVCAAYAGLMTEGNGEVGFSHADSAAEDDVFVAGEEVEPKEVLDLVGGNFVWVVKLVGIEGALVGKLGGVESALVGAFAFGVGFALN